MQISNRPPSEFHTCNGFVRLPRLRSHLSKMIAKMATPTERMAMVKKAAAWIVKYDIHQGETRPQIHPDGVIPDPANRDGQFVQIDGVMQNSRDITTIGFVLEWARCICVQLPLAAEERDEIFQFKLKKSSHDAIASAIRRASAVVTTATLPATASAHRSASASAPAAKATALAGRSTSTSVTRRLRGKQPTGQTGPPVHLQTLSSPSGTSNLEPAEQAGPEETTDTVAGNRLNCLYFCSKCEAMGWELEMCTSFLGHAPLGRNGTWPHLCRVCYGNTVH